MELGPVGRHGAMGAMESLCLRDPDGNLVELAHYRELRLSRKFPHLFSTEPQFAPYLHPVKTKHPINQRLIGFSL